MNKLAIAAAFAISAMGLTALRAGAMPPFVQVYGTDCNVCHTMVQRTGFVRGKSTGSLDKLRPNFKTTTAKSVL